MTTGLSSRVAAVQERRRSGAAGPHKDKRRKARGVEKQRALRERGESR